ncbi:erg24, C-14 sterol reductase [Saitoella coloradoensis]
MPRKNANASKATPAAVDAKKVDTRDIKPVEPLNPKTTHYEFAGTIGALGVTLLTPAFTYLLYFACNETSCSLSSLSLSSLQSRLPGWTGLVDPEAIRAYLKWWQLLLILWVVIPAPWVEGTELRDGTRAQYKMNGFRTFVVVIAMQVGVLLWYGPGHVVFTFVWEHYLGLITAACLFSFALAVHVYASSYIPVKNGGSKLLALGGNSGNVIYDFFIGRELNPTLNLPFLPDQPFDIKQFAELRPGIILWVALNIAFAAHQFVEFGRVTDSMVLVCVFQGWYCLDSLWNEEAVLTTMDITTDGFGFMLSFGDLVWVPFTYSLQARYLASHPVDLGLWKSATIVAVQLAGYYIFRSANTQKNTFRNTPTHPSVSHLAYLQTSYGTRLITSGWWGTARHINYLGDWIMAWAWCLPTGFATPITYFYVGFFAVLLLHRERRDEEKCGRKYGKDWEEYKRRVRWRIVPYVY